MASVQVAYVSSAGLLLVLVMHPHMAAAQQPQAAPVVPARRLFQFDQGSTTASQRPAADCTKTVTVYADYAYYAVGQLAVITAQYTDCSSIPIQATLELNVPDEFRW